MVLFTLIRLGIRRPTPLSRHIRRGISLGVIEEAGGSLGGTKVPPFRAVLWETWNRGKVDLSGF